MQKLSFVKDYRRNEDLRKSFFSLAKETFGIRFETWHKHGFWNDRYIPFSYVKNGNVIANVSVNLVDLIIEGNRKSAVQLGTVMTHPDYRGNGLSASLMYKVLEEFENKFDFIYLFANDSVLHFYPKFGFRPVEEHIYYADSFSSQSKKVVRKLNGNEEKDLRFIYKYASERMPLSQSFGTDCTQGILMYYCMNIFPNNIYYMEDEDVIVMYERNEKQIDLYDIIGRKRFSIQNVISAILEPSDEKVMFHFTPDFKELQAKSIGYDGNLFVKERKVSSYPLHVKHPITSIA